MFADIPTELIQRVFSQFDDIETLRAAALCCRTFYQAFTSIEELLTANIIVRQIHPTVLPHAIIVHVSSTLTNEHAVVRNFSEDYLSKKLAPPTTWKIADALPLSRFHASVNRFATRLSCTALEHAPSSPKDPPQQEVPTITEVLRVQRALYCYQLFCNMFSYSNFDQDELRPLFFSHFSTWEN
jgi:hypothetical protein